MNQKKYIILLEFPVQITSHTKKTTSTTTPITTITNKTHTGKSVDINSLPNIIDQIIRENYIQENQTLVSDLHHFPKSLIIDNTTKISAKSVVVDLLPENYNVLENDIKSFNQNDQKDRNDHTDKNDQKE